VQAVVGMRQETHSPTLAVVGAIHDPHPVRLVKFKYWCLVILDTAGNTGIVCNILIFIPRFIVTIARERAEEAEEGG
jgi:hypothetical protein